MKAIIAKTKTRLIEEIKCASLDCSVFADTECFGCGLCNWAREEKKYYDEFMENYDGYGMLIGEAL